MLLEAWMNHMVDLDEKYGYPLFAYGRFVTKQGSQINTLYHERDVIKPGWTKVVRPNTDTLYSSMFYDLSQADIVFSIPEFDDRFWSFSFFDLYGNNFSSVMAHLGDKPGKYRLTFAANNDMGLRFNEDTSDEQGVVGCPTPYGVLTVRILLRDQKGDVKSVHGFQDAIGTTLVPRQTKIEVPPLDLEIFSQVKGSEGNPVSEEEQVLHLTAMLSDLNLSEVVRDRSWIASTLEKAGISNGKFTQPPRTSLSAAVIEADRSGLALKATSGFVRKLGNDWYANSPMISGDFRSFYAARYMTAKRGYLGTSSEQAVYPSYVPPGREAGIPDITIGPRQAIKVSFSGKPRLHPLGFWSLSLYGKDQLFIPNELEHYALGDRSDLRYVDGVPLADREDGKFELLIQPVDCPPPSQWNSNWLPAPPGGGEVSFTLRLFGASSAMIEGSYEYPKVTLMDAITA
ncbi:hypothetical protein PV04_00896 [Phialophora macrospora]|uniref:DUF1214 domain-containing protein n=1 Tax=Phialophora macrospora TaxID=1851006 RepID=A0A0D2G1Q4_9EURO|nr:hypothetical protein PV04_00896 [Phialophora macrospora]